MGNDILKRGLWAMGDVTLNHISTTLAMIIIFINAFNGIKNVLNIPARKTDAAVQKQKVEDVCRLTAQHTKDIEEINNEGKVLCRGILACLKGLEEQGCNGPVKSGIKELENHLINSSHRL